jgi:hypothetical protein
MKHLHTKYKDLYTAVPPTQLPIVTYGNYDIADTAPNEDENVEALSRMRPRKTPGASGITIKDIKMWHHKARITEENGNKDIAIWDNIINIVTIGFTTGPILSSFYNIVLVLVSKPGNNGFRGIVFLETI